jgi:hypothetical protein
MKQLHITLFSTLIFTIASTTYCLSGQHPAPVEVSVRVSEQTSRTDRAYYGEVDVKFYQGGQQMTDVITGPYDKMWLRGFDLTKPGCTDAQAVNNSRLAKNQCQVPGTLSRTHGRTEIWITLQEKPYKP